jgi:hypothetical protein
MSKLRKSIKIDALPFPQQLFTVVVVDSFLSTLVVLELDETKAAFQVDIANLTCACKEIFDITLLRISAETANKDSVCSHFDEKSFQVLTNPHWSDAADELFLPLSLKLCHSDIASPSLHQSPLAGMSDRKLCFKSITLAPLL